MIGVQHLSGQNHHPGKSDGQPHTALALLATPNWCRVERPDADGDPGQFHQIPHTAIDQQSRPAVAPSQLSKTATDESAPERSPAIHDQYSSVSFAFQRPADQRIVFEYLERLNRSAEMVARSVVSEQRLEDTDRLGVGIG